ncbi:MAG: hypothetical protein NTU94_03260 [Planctomycetota bacterium]|nr:hypothetical protein [Planctomycetota bacterium]
MTSAATPLRAAGLLARRTRDLHWLVVVFAVLFIAQYMAREFLIPGG